MKIGFQSGFLLLEVLIAGLILTASVASAMYMFRSGFENLERAERANLLSAKLLQAGSYLKIVELEKLSGAGDLGDGVTIKWTSRLLARPRGERYTISSQGKGFERMSYLHDLFLYRVDFSLDYQGAARDYCINVFRSRPHTWR